MFLFCFRDRAAKGLRLMANVKVPVQAMATAFNADVPQGATVS